MSVFFERMKKKYQSGEIEKEKVAVAFAMAKDADSDKTVQDLYDWLEEDTDV